MIFNRVYINRGFWALFLFFIPAIIFSQNTLERTWLWQVSGGELEGKSYLFGTMPVQDSTFFQFNKRVWRAMKKTDVFVGFDMVENSTYQQFYEHSFNDFPKHYSVTPATYLQDIAKQELKPIVLLGAQHQLASLYNGSVTSTTKNSSFEERKKLKETYLSADLPEFVLQRISMDVPENIYATLASRNNYKITNELIDKMRLQPVFAAVDAIYLPGEEGLVNLLRARGFQVKPIAEKDYAKVAEQIMMQKQMAQQWQQPNQPTAQVSQNEINTDNQPIAVPTTPTTQVKLDLPMGVLNLSQWSNYQLNNEKYSYSAPKKLKAVEGVPGKYSATYGGLEYQLEEVEKWTDLSAIIERLIIQNGGQLVLEKDFKNQSITGKLVELMYAEDKISKHLLLEGLSKDVILTVKGETPEIHTVLANRFFNSFELDQVPETPTSGIDLPLPIGAKTQPVAPTAPQWYATSLDDLNFNFPAIFTKEETKTDSGQPVKALIASKKVDKNTFVIVSSKKEAFDQFRLFNTAINTAAEEVRGVVVERNVMPEGRSNFAEYLIKDAVENYYRVQYYYHNERFYQIIAKGDKKSVYNDNAERVFQSILFY